MNCYKIKIHYIQAYTKSPEILELDVVAKTYPEAITKGILELDGVIQPDTSVAIKFISKCEGVIV